MNISAPASVPDLANLALPAGTDIVAALPGFAPPQFLAAGAGTLHSFESTFAQLLSVAGKLEERPEDPKQQESKTVITGVATATPPPAALPFQLAAAFQPVVTADASEPVPTPALTELPPGLGKTGEGTPALDLRRIPAPPQPEDVAWLFGFDAHSLKSSEPQAAPRGTLEPVLAMVEPRTATAPELTPADLPNLAFAEKFTEAPPAPDAALAAPHPLPSAPPAGVWSPRTAGHLPESAKDQADGVPPPPPADIGEPTQAPPAQRHGNDERQHASGEPPQPKTYTENTAREDSRIEKAGFEPLAPVAISGKETPSSQSPQPAATRSPADIPHMEPEPSRVQSAPLSHTSDMHAISLRVTDAGDARVELKVTEHAGELRVAVRTADPDLAGSLRENLGDLVHKLEQSGFRADTWHPAPASSAEGSRQAARAEGESRGGDHPARQQQHSGDGRERKQQDPERAGWIDAFETSLGPDSERKAPTWLPASVH